MKKITIAEKKVVSKKIRSILINNEISSYDEVSSKIKETLPDIEVSPSSIRRYVKELGYEKSPDTGYYVLSKARTNRGLEVILKLLIYYAQPEFKVLTNKSIYMLLIFTDKPVENAIGESISIYREDKVLGFSTGKKCTTIYLDSKEHCDSLKKELIRFKEAPVKDF